MNDLVNPTDAERQERERMFAARLSDDFLCNYCGGPAKWGEFEDGIGRIVRTPMCAGCKVEKYGPTVAVHGPRHLPCVQRRE